MRAIYSFNKTGFEERYWQRELAYSDGSNEIVPFNHGRFIDPSKMMRAQLLDNLYFAEDPSLNSLYGEVKRLIAETGADCLIVDNVLPYHPEFLRSLDVYKVLRIADGPMSCYDRDFAYVHAYDHVVHHSNAYSRDLGMAEKLRYVGAKRVDFWPHAAFDALCNPSKSETEILTQPRDIEIIFVGGLFPNKMPILAKMKKAFGSKLMLRGRSNLKLNAYFNLRYNFPGWVRPIAFEDYVPLYQRTKIGINVHNRGKYTVGGYRMYDLPANGVMQICDGEEYLGDFFNVGEEVVGYASPDELIDKVRYYLEHDQERARIAANGYRRVMADHRIRRRLEELVGIVNDATGAQPTAARTRHA
jgi:spore maturation protein CgeB